jgi:hypothetical protein
MNLLAHVSTMPMRLIRNTTGAVIVIECNESIGKPGVQGVLSPGRLQVVCMEDVEVASLLGRR